MSWVVAERGLRACGCLWTWVPAGPSQWHGQRVPASCSGQTAGYGVEPKWPPLHDAPRSSHPWGPQASRAPCWRAGQLCSQLPKEVQSG